MAFKEVDIKSLTFNPFTKIGSEWMLITAGDQSGYNTMTASWGGLGVLWGKNVATCYIRRSATQRNSSTRTIPLPCPSTDRSTNRHSPSAVPNPVVTAIRSKKPV